LKQVGHEQQNVTLTWSNRLYNPVKR
jgi:hypothetical protein